MKKPDCLIPAAGESSRMGAWKPLLPFKDTTIIDHVIETALINCGRIILVTGYRAGELETHFENRRDVVTVRNERWRRGMFSSIQTGMARVRTSRFFIALGDMPWIRGEIYKALLDYTPADILFAAYRGVRGHPVLFSSRVKDTVCAADPDSGRMREICSNFGEQVLNWPDNSIIRDIDTPEDYNS